MTWNEFKSLVDKFLSENNISEDVCLDYFDFINADDLDVEVDETYGLRITEKCSKEWA